MRSIRLATCLFASVLSVSAPGLSAAQASEEELLKRRSVEWMTAIEKKDRTTLEQILADSFVLQNPGDSAVQFTRRAEWIDNAIKMNWSNFRYENIEARVNGDHATVSSRLFFKVSPMPLTFDAGVVDTWEKRDGKWQVTTRYLGESKLSQRLAFFSGVLAAAVAALAVRLLTWLRKRGRAGPA